MIPMNGCLRLRARQWMLALGVALILTPMTMATAQAATMPAAAAASSQVSFQQLKAVVDQRCAMCHNAQLQSKGISFDSPEHIKQHAQQMYQQAAVLKTMPLNNATQITPAERDLIKRWYEAGAHVE